MGKFAKAAGAEALTGPVAVTDASGQTTTYASEAEAEAALPSGASVLHRRGGFLLQKAPAQPSRKRKRSTSSD